MIHEMNPSREMPELDREERMREEQEDRCKYAHRQGFWKEVRIFIKNKKNILSNSDVK